MCKTKEEKLPSSGLNITLTQVPFFIIVLYSLFFGLLLIACYLILSMSILFLVVILFVIAYGYLLFTKHLLRVHPYAIKKLIFTELYWCYVQYNNGQVIKADIAPNTILNEYWMILNLIEHSEKSPKFFFLKDHSILLTEQDLGNKPFRQVKRYLRLINFSRKPVT